MGMGSAMTRTPEMAQQVPISLPRPVVGWMSPYPTVVIVMIAHQKLAGIEVKPVS